MDQQKKKIEPKKLFAERFMECIIQHSNKELSNKKLSLNLNKLLEKEKESYTYGRYDDIWSANTIVQMCKFCQNNKIFTIPYHITLEGEMWSEFVVLCEKSPGLSDAICRANILVLDVVDNKLATTKYHIKDEAPYIVYKTIEDNKNNPNKSEINTQNKQGYDVRKAYNDRINDIISKKIKMYNMPNIVCKKDFIYKYAMLFFNDFFTPFCFYLDGDVEIYIFNHVTEDSKGIFKDLKTFCLSDQLKMFINIYNAIFTQTLDINIDNLTKDKVKEISDYIKKHYFFNELLNVFELVWENVLNERSKHLQDSRAMVNIYLININNRIKLLKDAKQLMQNQFENNEKNENNENNKKNNDLFIDDVIQKLTQEVSIYEQSINNMSQNNIDEITCKFWQIIPIYGGKILLLAKNNKISEERYETSFVKYFFHVQDQLKFHNLPNGINQQNVIFDNSDINNIYTAIQILSHIGEIKGHYTAELDTSTRLIKYKNNTDTITIDLNNIGPTELMFYGLCMLCTVCYNDLGRYCRDGTNKYIGPLVSYIYCLTSIMVLIAKRQQTLDPSILKDGKINFIEISQDLYEKIANKLPQSSPSMKKLDLYKFLEIQLQRLANNFKQNENIDNVIYGIDNADNTPLSINNAQNQQMIINATQGLKKEEEQKIN